MRCDKRLPLTPLLVSSLTCLRGVPLILVAFSALQQARLTLYNWAPAVPDNGKAFKAGHGSASLAFREPTLYDWLLRQRLPPRDAGPRLFHEHRAGQM